MPKPSEEVHRGGSTATDDLNSKCSLWLGQKETALTDGNWCGLRSVYYNAGVILNSFAQWRSARTLRQGSQQEKGQAVALDHRQTDRRRGAILGLAIGDALGAAVEFQPAGSFPEVTGFCAGDLTAWNRASGLTTPAWPSRWPIASPTWDGT